MQAKDYEQSFFIDAQGLHTIFTVPKPEAREPIIIELREATPAPAAEAKPVTEVAPTKIAETIPKLTTPPKNMSFEEARATVSAFLRDHKELPEQQKIDFVNTVAGKINIIEVLHL
jgi:predicted ArsR family transcriptional regulator